MIISLVEKKYIALRVQQIAVRSEAISPMWD
jgi:hypothetical protein